MSNRHTALATPLATRLATRLIGLGALCLSLAAGAQTSVAPLAATEMAGRFERAVQLYRQQQYAAAYGRFARLADQGHAQAAQIAWLMYSSGPALYGTEWFASPEQLRRWTVQAIGTEGIRLSHAGE